LPPISNPEALARVARLSADVDAAAVVVQAAQADVNDAAKRERDLRAAQTEHAAIEPAQDPDVTAELAQLLADNPTAAASADWEGRLREAQDATAAALSAWRGKRTIIAQALSSVSDQLTARREALAEAKRLHEIAWEGFVNVALDVMTAELEARWGDFYGAVMGPLDALNQARRLYANEPVYSGPRRSVTHDSVLAIGTPKNGSIHYDVMLYPSPRTADLFGILAGFRASLTTKPKR
jgi:hypothetical protein